ncbi:MRG/MORF4L-binding protein-like [Mizuhopecten yessoensis]|uniref:MRG/MORF4L-binding protein n=1 Tax=Mizuhopecten yessoensis TaxID=6573 RepID=A0A210PNK9_MIZYE|nr:MRG/MORF4L-binding protein-like [Mizuhopecten yessoensis]OWF38090.1 MRG/MORF4L-binding protein [Mizuhopecten yessoensis]
MADAETVEMEVSLFHAMRGHKPVGVNRHFQMLVIHDKLNNSFSRKVTSKQIWNRLITMYDLTALNESEILPFPNKEVDFLLPDEDFSDFTPKEFPRSNFTSHKFQDDSKSDKSDTSSKDTHISVSKPTKADKHESKPENKHTSNLVHGNTPENSPKRKRTRQTHSTHTSPATPEVPSKRRR